MALDAAVNIGLLAAFKYLGFFAGTLNALVGTDIPVPSMGLPLGISFFTFTGLGYVIEVYRKPETVSRQFVETALYIALFPNLLSGPILRWRDAAPQLRERSCTAEKTARGLRRFILGLAKKLLIADLVGAMADAAYGAALPDARLAWLGAVSYAVQIYYDFSGYSDMALGLASVFGFELPENFRHPYAALDMTDFWKRWHISLTTWFRNYLYMPIVLSDPAQRQYRRWSARFGRAAANRLSILFPSAVVWLLTGLWHGAAWSFVLWGVWNGLFCVLEGVGLIRTAGCKKTAGRRLLLRVYTLGVALLGTVLFRAGSLAGAGKVLLAMAAGWSFTPEGTLILQRCGSVRPGGGGPGLRRAGSLAAAAHGRLGRAGVLRFRRGCLCSVRSEHGGQRLPALYLRPVLTIPWFRMREIQTREKNNVCAVYRPFLRRLSVAHSRPSVGGTLGAGGK